MFSGLVESVRYLLRADSDVSEGAALAAPPVNRPTRILKEWR